jgi:hypothetical protein
LARYFLFAFQTPYFLRKDFLFDEIRVIKQTSIFAVFCSFKKQLNSWKFSNCFARIIFCGVFIDDAFGLLIIASEHWIH